jgi:hypothetical protein
MADYTITLILNTEAEDPEQAAQYFTEFVRDQRFAVRVEDDRTGESFEIDA